MISTHPQDLQIFPVKRLPFNRITRKMRCKGPSVFTQACQILEVQMSTKFEVQMSIPFTGKKVQMPIAHMKGIHKFLQTSQSCLMRPLQGTLK